MSAAPACAVCPAPHDGPAHADLDGRVSVIVTHYEQHEQLDRTLHCLARQIEQPAEVIVTDDGSGQPPRVPEGVRVLRQDDRGFRAALARNRAAAAAGGDVLVFLDADTAPEPGLVAALAGAVRAEPDLLVVGRRRHADLGPFDPRDPLAERSRVEHPEPAWLREGWAATDDLRAADDGSFRFVLSAVMACSARWFARAGGFEERFERYGGEDWELAHRFWTAGGRLRHLPDAVAWHDGPDAGLRPRSWDRPAHALDPATRETLDIARRLPAWPTRLRGLHPSGTPADVVTTLGPDLDPRAQLIAVDGLLAEVPRAVVLGEHHVWDTVGDPRVGHHHAQALRRAAVHVHVHRPVAGSGWAALADSPDPGRTEWHDERGAVVTTTRLRDLRRDHLGLEPIATRETALPFTLRAADDTSLAAWLGGWC